MMIFLTGLEVLVSYYLVITYFVKKFDRRLFLLMFTISTIYYGVLGPWYWIEFRDAQFLGVGWEDKLDDVTLSFLMTHQLVLVTFAILEFSNEKIYIKRQRNVEVVDYDIKINRALWIMFALGVASSLYVIIQGGLISEIGGAYTDDPILLIALQFSDMPIAGLLFLVGERRVSKKWYLGAVLFIGSSVLVGLRYKIMIFLAPIIILLFFRKGKRQKSIQFSLIVLGIIVVIGFSFMTIARNKFSGIDFDAIYDATAEDLLYGFFADSNLIFGLASSYRIFGESVSYVGISPIVDSIVQFVPRFIYPEKHLYQHLEAVMLGLGGTQEALSSGTTIPYFGEYYAMFGWVGVFVGVVCYAVFCRHMLNHVLRYAGPSQAILSVGLIAVYMGYYYFSRGSMAQISKGLIFIYLPYVYLVKLSYLQRQLLRL